MRVDLVIGTLNVGGAERQLTGLAVALHRAGVEVRVLTLFGNGPLLASLENAGVPIHSMNGGRSTSGRGDLPRIVPRLAQTWMRNRPDVVQAWLPREQAVALPLAKAMRIPVRIMAVRSLTSSVRMSRARQVAIGLAARSSTAVVTNSAAVLDDPGWPISGLPAFVVGNAVDIPDTAADPSQSPPRAVVVANYHPYKGHSDLLEALTAVSTPIAVDLVGSGPVEAAIRADVDRLGLKEWVTVVGAVPDATPYFVRSQFAILPSHTEGLPNAVLEAMAAGLPVVAYDVGGVAELVEPDVTGILAPARNVEALAEGIQFAAENPQWRYVAGARGREVAATMTWDHLAGLNLEIMEAALRSGR